MVPGTGLVSNAADMARFYAAIVSGGAIDGARILRTETVDKMLDIAVYDEVDPSFGVAVRRCYGFELGGMDEPRRHSPGLSATARTIWHGGMSTSVCWGDRDTGLAFSYLTNGLRRDKAGAFTRRDLSDACGRRGPDPAPVRRRPSAIAAPIWFLSEVDIWRLERRRVPTVEAPREAARPA